MILVEKRKNNNHKDTVDAIAAATRLGTQDRRLNRNIFTHTNVHTFFLDFVYCLDVRLESVECKCVKQLGL